VRSLEGLNEIERLSSQQREAGLTAAANAQLQELLNRYDQAVLRRARAIALLKQRGQDVWPLLQQPVAS
jgi:hypothetical protein